MQHRFAGVATAALALITGSAVWAQTPGSPPPFGGMHVPILRSPTYTMQLVSTPEVQEDLHLTTEQKDKLKARKLELEKQAVERMKKIRQAETQPGRAEQEDTSPEALRKKQQELAEEEKKWVTEWLDKGQKRRLDQIDLQYDLLLGEPMRALERKDVADALKVTPTEKEQFNAILRDADRRVRNCYGMVDLASLTSDGVKKLQAKVKTIKVGVGDKLIASLTEEQQAKWKESLGEPFSFPVSLANPEGAPASK